MGLVAPWHVGSSPTGAPTCVPCIGRRILNHWATREVLEWIFFKKIIFLSSQQPLSIRRFKSFSSGKCSYVIFLIISSLPCFLISLSETPTTLILEPLDWSPDFLVFFLKFFFVFVLCYLMYFFNFMFQLLYWKFSSNISLISKSSFLFFKSSRFIAFCFSFCHGYNVFFLVHLKMLIIWFLSGSLAACSAPVFLDFVFSCLFWSVSFWWFCWPS